MFYSENHFSKTLLKQQYYSNDGEIVYWNRHSPKVDPNVVVIVSKMDKSL